MNRCDAWNEKRADLYLLAPAFAMCLAVLPVPLTAAPVSAALVEAREAVHSLLAEDFRKLNAGRCTLVDVADRVADLASASNSPAMVRVLQEGAFNIYWKAGKLQRAATSARISRHRSEVEGRRFGEAA